MARDKASKVERAERAIFARADRRPPQPNEVTDEFTPTATEDSTAQDWLVAEAARRDFDDETVDGLSELEEEVRHAAEDLPADEPWEERVRRKAHELWQEEGGQHGRAEDHWRIASQLVGEEIAQSRADLPYLGDTDAPPEEAALLDNLGEFPDLADQGQDETSEPPER